MSRPASTLNEFEMQILAKSKLTNFELQQFAMKSFVEHRGNLRKVIGDLLDKIQTLYMERTELEHIHKGVADVQ